ncbi:unnamed protein product [Pedinophyceae sp. YPF-701]|nr:unnamed protein product [Pedinophyceae sp. YPF-701]
MEQAILMLAGARQAVPGLPAARNVTGASDKAEHAAWPAETRPVAAGSGDGAGIPRMASFDTDAVSAARSPSSSMTTDGAHHARPQPQPAAGAGPLRARGRAPPQASWPQTAHPSPCSTPSRRWRRRPSPRPRRGAHAAVALALLHQPHAGVAAGALAAPDAGGEALRSAASAPAAVGPGEGARWKGVSWDKQQRKWQAHISVRGRMIKLGRYDCAETAALAYNEACEILGWQVANDLGAARAAVLAAPAGGSYIRSSTAAAKLRGLRSHCAPEAPKRRTSRFVGVGWHKINAKWQAQMCLQAKQLNLGYYECETDAALAYDSACVLLGREPSNQRVLPASISAHLDLAAESPGALLSRIHSASAAQQLMSASVVAAPAEDALESTRSLDRPLAVATAGGKRKARPSDDDEPLRTCASADPLMMLAGLAGKYIEEDACKMARSNGQPFVKATH